MAALAVFAVAFLYFAALHAYGFQVEDEGTLLFWLDRVLRGQFPYTDFHTGYTPGYFYFGAGLLAVVGESATRLRLLVAAVNAASAAAMYVVARRYTGAAPALVAPALWVAFIPVYPGEFAAFNVPYPAWFATLAWLGVTLALVDWSERGGLGRLATAGVHAALAFAIKPNAGAFALAACTWSIVCIARADRGVDRVLGVAAALAMGIGVWVAFGMALTGRDAAVHLVPLAVMVAMVAGPLAGAYADPRHPRASVALVVLGGSFLSATAIWAIPVLAKLGAGAFAREVLLLGSDAAALYHLPHPAPEPYALGVVGAVVALAIGGWLVRGWRLSPVTAMLGALVAVAVAGVLVDRFAVMPETAAQSISFQLENASYWLALLVNWAGLVMLATSARRMRPFALDRSLAVLVPCAIAMYWQLYPRTDFMHAVIAAPLTLVLGVYLLSRVAEWWCEGAWPSWLSARAVVGTIIAAAVGAVVGLEVAPVVVAAAPCVVGARYAIDTPRLRVCVEPDVSDDLAAFGRAASYLTTHAHRGEKLLPFPATAGLAFAAGLVSPVPHDYWYPGRPDHRDEQAMLATLRADPPRWIATLNTGWTFFLDAPEYFLDVRDFVVNDYELVARFGRFDLLARRDAMAGLPRTITTPPAGSAAGVIEPRLAKRVQAVRRWMASLTPEEAAGAALPADERSALLLLRAIRNGGDIRAAGWLMAGYRSPSARVYREAVEATKLVSQRFEAARFRWANDLEIAALRPYVERYRDDALVLVREGSGAPRELAIAILYILGST